MNTCTAILVSAFTLSAYQLSATTLEAPNSLLRLEVNGRSPEVNERISIKESGVWSPALSTKYAATRVFSPKVVGGFTTQNTDAEWSDARESYAAVLLWDYYEATGDQEYLERAVAAARSTFAVAPWENWAHTGYSDEPGALTGFHWGPGSGMTSIEIMSPALGDAFIDLQRKNGVGFNACSLQNLRVNNHSISFDLTTFPSSRKVTVRFSGVDSHASYQIACNGIPSRTINGDVLARDGYTISQ